MVHVSCVKFPFVRGATLFSSCGRTVLLLFWCLLSRRLCRFLQTDRDEAVGRWTNEGAGVVQGYAEEMHASNGNRLETFTRVHCLSSIRACPIQALSINARTRAAS